ncbi:MAG: 30S ribosome-binding factor RbfA [Waddliaceae bacterium]
MTNRRVPRLNSLLREVISEVIERDVSNPKLPSLITVTEVSITEDLHYAKVYITVLGDPKAKQQAVEILNEAAGFIGVTASKKVVMRFFPALTFILDETLEKRLRIEEILGEISQEKRQREND